MEYIVSITRRNLEEHMLEGQYVRHTDEQFTICL